MITLEARTPGVSWQTANNYITATDGNGLVLLAAPDELLEHLPKDQAPVVLAEEAVNNAAVCKDRSQLLPRLAPVIQGVHEPADYSIFRPFPVGGDLIALLSVNLDSHRAVLPIATLKQANITWAEAWVAAGKSTQAWLNSGQYSVKAYRHAPIIRMTDPENRSPELAAWPALISRVAREAGIGPEILWAVPSSDVLLIASDTPEARYQITKLAHTEWLQAGQNAVSCDVLNLKNGKPSTTHAIL